jgi:uncharacterized protein YndB with AHSA1/START domain
MTTETADLTIRKTLHVDAPVERAFDVFTNGLPDWWPSDTHSVDKGTPDIDWRVGGTAGELVRGERKEWADILEFDPPQALALRWRVDPENPPTHVRVTFTAEGDGTRVELTHSGWEAYGAAAQESFNDYNGGWDAVLGHYVRFVAND